jgi:phosphate-selective porin OprO/OprP
MKRLALISFLGILLISFGGQSVLAEEDTDFKMYWKNGIRFQTADKAFSFKFGGRIMNDWAFMSEDESLKAAIGQLQDATTEFRRARLYISGTVYEKVIFKAQYDFAGGDADFKDVYLGLKKLPGVGTLKVGHFKEAFGLEELTSSKYITFMERSLPVIFAPSRNTGIGVNNTALNKRLTWAAGLFLDTGDYGDEDDAENSAAATARITGLPWYQGKDRLLHLGLSYSNRDAKDDTVEYDQSPEAHLAPDFVDTGSIVADSENRFGIEVALVHGPFSLQGEYMGANVETPDGSDPSFSGYYASASYFLTGEHRAYKNSSGTFDRVKPKTNFGKGGTGAWEVALRYSGLDLNDAPIQGGELEDITFGLNWYLNPNVRAMFNYVLADLDTVGNADIVQLRFQIDF